MFMHDDFLLNSKTARVLYHEYAELMPIIDYHCHIDVKEITEDIHYDNITQAWIALDHYKWTAMRTNGISEKFITGEASDKEKFMAWSRTLPRCIGSPLYHRSHIELSKYFGFKKALSEETAEEAWRECNDQLQDGFSARKMIEKYNVKLISTTDDIFQKLIYHEKLAQSTGFRTKVIPTFRTDKLVNINKPAYKKAIKSLSEVTGQLIDDFQGLVDAMETRMSYFDALGCKSVDQALNSIPFTSYRSYEIDEILQKAITGEKLSEIDCMQYTSALLEAIAYSCQKRGWVLQLHCGAMRDKNTRLFNMLGDDVGGDCIGLFNNLNSLPDFFNHLDAQGKLPKTIIYSINPADNPIIDSTIGCFQTDEMVGKIQHGSAWWFNDHKLGIEAHIKSLSSMSVLGNYIGTLTDSRAFLNYSRHEYFRRILCNTLGQWVEQGEYPDDLNAVGNIVRDICYNNVNRYFGFDL